MKSLLVPAVLGLVACATIRATDDAIPTGVPLRGRVLYPDGSPAAGATVRATTACENQRVGFVKDAVTDEEGTFDIPSFDSRCGTFRFTAEKRESFWLRTGTEVFYPRENGTSPEVTLASVLPPDPITVQLDQRGGELELRVWDESAEAFVRAGLDIECPETWCGAMSTATGEGGAPDTVFLPARRYRVALHWYLCGSKTYFPETGPDLMVEVTEGQRQSAVLEVDIATIPAISSYDNFDGAPCRQ